MATYWSKIAEKTYPIFIWHVPWDEFLDESYLAKNYNHGTIMHMVYISRSCFRSGRHNTGV